MIDGNDLEGEEQGDDRLSSLPDDILIKILSCLPLRLAIVTGSLSRQWRDLWTNVSSVEINHVPKYLSSYDEVMPRLISPTIDTFRMEHIDLINYETASLPSLHSCLRQICDRNVLALKLPCRKYWGPYSIYLPSFILETQSLVSIELGSMFRLKLRKDGDSINLPNLKQFSFEFSPSESELLEKLISSCPSLEQLCLKSDVYIKSEYQIMCSNQNLRRLIINIRSSEKGRIVINAPKLEFLAVDAPKSTMFRFIEESVLLREAKIGVTSVDHSLLEHENKVMSKFYGSICNVRIVSLDVYVLENVSTVFPYATRLILNMRMFRDINIVSTLVELFPVLDSLTLQFYDIDTVPRNLLHKPDHISSSLRRVLKQIHIEIIDSSIRCEPQSSFVQLIEYLLRNAIDLKKFRFSLIGDVYWLKQSIEFKEIWELNWCKLLYHCPMVSTGCEVEFAGRVLNMSRKAGPKIWNANGEVFHLT